MSVKQPCSPLCCPAPFGGMRGSPNTLTSSKARVVQARVKAYGAIAGCVVGTQSRAVAGRRAIRRWSEQSDHDAPQTACPQTNSATQGPAHRNSIEDWGATIRMGP